MKFVRLLMAAVLTAFFIVGAHAEKNKYQGDPNVCAPETQEAVLVKGAQESPDLFMAEVEGADLKIVFKRLENLRMLIGEPPTDKMYVFLSENHPTWVYVFFLKEHCIVDVKFTYKNLVEYLLTGDESKIKPTSEKHG